LWAFYPYLKEAGFFINFLIVLDSILVTLWGNLVRAHASYFIDGMTADAVLLNRSNPVLAAGSFGIK
jgi:hypothetical protein